MIRSPLPDSIDTLVERAERVAGRTLGWLAGEHDAVVPPNLKGHKGWVGTLIEAVLGAPGGGADGPDFPALGVELKSLPVDAAGRVRESTWVCTAPLDGSLPAVWAESRVRRKLGRVLWVPVVWSTGDPLASRRVGNPISWMPGPQEEVTLRTDWEEISEGIRMGHLDRLDARMGEALQLRPKGAKATDTTWFLDGDGSWVQTNPRGFYLTFKNS